MKMMINWADLPEEMLSLILSNLFAKDRQSFSLVCKPWNNAAKFSPFRHSPCLLYHQKTNNCASWKLFQYNGFVSMDLPQHLDGADIRCAKHGWMLMSKSDLTVFFHDPFNKETIHLPKPDSKYSVLYFFHPPTSQDCFVVGISTLLCTEDVEIGVLRRGENEWRRRVYHQSDSSFRLSRCTPVLHNRLLHFLDVDGNIGTFDVGRSGSHGIWTVLTKSLLPPQLSSRTRQRFLIELRNDKRRALLSVLVTYEERKVNVFRLLLSGPSMIMKWVPVDDLGDKVLFVSHMACFAATENRQSMANRIYFAKTHGDDDVVYWCLGTRRYRSCKGDYPSKELNGTFKDLNFATWITATPTPEVPRDLTWFTTTTVDVAVS